MIIVVRNYGQLGNRLQLSAHLIAAAREYNVTLLNPSFTEYAHYFTSTHSDLWCRYPALPPSPGKQPPSTLRRWATHQAMYLSGKMLGYAQRVGLPAPMIQLPKDGLCDPGSENFKRLAQSSIPLLVSGFGFYNRSLLVKHAAEIRAHFEIAPVHRARVNSLMQRARNEGDVTVGIHIRHGDYVRFRDGIYYYTIPQYVAMMRQIEEQLSGRKVAFCVCGNSKLDRRDFGDLNVHFGTGHLVEDMYSFAETDLLVGPPSSFTGWASFYGRVPRIAMRTADQQLELPTSLGGTAAGKAA